MVKEYLNPTTLFPSLQHGFSQIVCSDAGKMVFLSGQVAWDENKQIVGANDLRQQTLQTFKNIETAMAQAGGTLRDVVSLRIYIVGMNYDDDHHISAALKAYFPQANAPASTWIRVLGLANKDFMIEIEAQAVIES